MKVSVIVPVYNVAPWVEECVHSLMRQTLDEIEFIFIDDCSTDDSLERVRNTIALYPNRVNQVRILSNEVNLGVLETRQRGISEAIGEYICFCDSDDVVASNCYERLYDKCKSESLKLAFCEIGYFKDGEPLNPTKCPKYQGIKNTDDLLRRIFRFQNNGSCVSLCDKIYHRELLKDEKLEFPQNQLYEDRVINAEILIGINKTGYIPESLYFYRMRTGSSTHQSCSVDQMIKQRREAYENIALLENWLKRYGYWNRYRKDFLYTKSNVKLMHFDALKNSREAVNEWLNLYPNMWIELFFRSDMPWRVRLSLLKKTLMLKWMYITK